MKFYVEFKTELLICKNIITFFVYFSFIYFKYYYNLKTLNPIWSYILDKNSLFSQKFECILSHTITII